MEQISPLLHPDMAFFVGVSLRRLRKIEISGSVPILRNKFVPLLYRGGGGASSGLPGGTLAVRIFDFCIAMPASCGADMAFSGKKIQKHNMVTATKILVLSGDRPRCTFGMMRRDRFSMSTLVFILHLLRNMKNVVCPRLPR